MLTSATQERALDPRYRRVLSFGDVLDESIALFRRHWVVFALVSAVCLLPPGLIDLAIAAGGGLDTRALMVDVAARRTPDPNAIAGLVGAVVVISVLSGLFALAWTAAVAVITDEYLHGKGPELSRVLGHVARRYPVALLTAVLYVVAVGVVAIAAILLLVVSAILFPIFILGSVASVVGIIVWWFKPKARRRWLKWLIILATPFGLALYFGGLWSLGVVASVLERRGPIGALRRSMDLVDRHWFRATGILSVAAAIVSVLQYVPTVLIQLPLTIVALMHGQPSLGPTEQAVSIAAGVVTQVLFASMASIVYALLFVDLRNRREGTDIAERLRLVEAVVTDV